MNQLSSSMESQTANPKTRPELSEATAIGNQKSDDSRRLNPESQILNPVFSDPKHHIKIFQGDCLEILRAIPPDSVDLVFADPPYFLSNDGITCHAGHMVSVNKGAWDRSRGHPQGRASTGGDLENFR